MRVTEQDFQIHIQSKNDDKSSTKTLNIMIFQLYKYAQSGAQHLHCPSNQALLNIFLIYKFRNFEF